MAHVPYRLPKLLIHGSSGYAHRPSPGRCEPLVAHATYESATLHLGFPDQLTILSDGVVEAENANRELFGFERTRTISTKSAQEIAEAAKAWGQNDDITVVIARRNA